MKLDGVSAARSALRIDVKVRSGSCGNEVVGWSDGALRIEVVAPGRKGRADDAVESLLAEVLGVPRGRVRVVTGRGSNRKCVEIEDVDEAVLERQLPGRAAAPRRLGTARRGFPPARSAIRFSGRRRDTQ